MRNRVAAGLAGLSFVLSFSVALAQDARSSRLRLTPEEVAALPNVAPGAGTSGIATMKMSVLYGDPNISGPYTIALNVPPNTRIKAHSHKDTRTAVVVRGSWSFGYGGKANDPAFKVLGPGSFYTEPAKTAHFAKTGPEGALVYISGWGPSDTVYVE